MATANFQSLAWELVRDGSTASIARRQLVALGFTPEAIRQRIAKGRLHPLYRGVYAVGRPELTQHGRWMAAILAKGPAAVLSHRSAASLYGIALPKGKRHPRGGPCPLSSPQFTRHHGPPPQRAARHNAPRHPGDHHRGHPHRPRDPDTTTDQLEQAINEADKRDLIDPEALGEAAAAHEAARTRQRCGGVLDALRANRLPLEREFLRIAKRAGLPPRRPKPTSTATASTSTGPSSTSSSKPTASATTAPPPRRPPTASATRTTSSPA